MSDTFKLALAQHESTPADIDTSLSRIATDALNAAEQGCQLLLLPEASLTGYNNPVPSMRTVAQPAQGESARAIATICQNYQLAIAYGFAELDNNDVFNSVQLIDKHGDVKALYRKTHLWGDSDRARFRPGTDLHQVFELDGWKLGFLICYDIEFPENVRRLALEGAELLLVPTALMSPWTMIANKLVPVRALENQLYVAYANLCGSEFGVEYIGHSCIVGPDGTELSRASTSPQLLSAQLQKGAIADARQALPYHQDRRPALYTALGDTDRF